MCIILQSSDPTSHEPKVNECWGKQIKNWWTIYWSWMALLRSWWIYWLIVKEGKLYCFLVPIISYTISRKSLYKHFYNICIDIYRVRQYFRTKTIQTLNLTFIAFIQYPVTCFILWINSFSQLPVFTSMNLRSCIISELFNVPKSTKIKSKLCKQTNYNFPSNKGKHFK